MALVEVKVPDIGDFKDVAVIELLVKPGDAVAAEQSLGVDPWDFRLWVCLHEETHRVQFGAVPWLADHLLAEVHAFVNDLERELVAAERSRAMPEAYARERRVDAICTFPAGGSDGGQFEGDILAGRAMT